MMRAIIVVLALAFAGSTAFAQGAPMEAPREPLPRVGIFGGFGVWAGNISCNGSDCGSFSAAGGASGHLGYMLSPVLGILVDVWALTAKSDNVGLTFVTSTVDMRFWILPIVWVQAGLGEGHAVVHVDGLAAASGDIPVGEAAVGLQLLRRRNWDLDIALQVAQGTSTDSSGGNNTGRSTGLGVHLTWY